MSYQWHHTHLAFGTFCALTKLGPTSPPISWSTSHSVWRASLACCPLRLGRMGPKSSRFHETFLFSTPLPCDSSLVKFSECIACKLVSWGPVSPALDDQLWEGSGPAQSLAHGWGRMGMCWENEGHARHFASHRHYVCECGQFTRYSQNTVFSFPWKGLCKLLCGAGSFPSPRCNLRKAGFLLTLRWCFHNIQPISFGRHGFFSLPPTLLAVPFDLCMVRIRAGVSSQHHRPWFICEANSFSEPPSCPLKLEIFLTCHALESDRSIPSSWSLKNSPLVPGHLAISLASFCS